MAGEERVAYAVSAGIYSDYHIAAIFERREDAQIHAEDLNRVSARWVDDYEVEEFPLFASGERPRIVTLYSAGATGADAEITVRSDDQPAYAAEVRELRRPKAGHRFYANGEHPEGEWHFWAKARSREAAVKAVADRQALVRAERAGVA